MVIYCEARNIAFTQLTTAAIRNMIAAMVMASEVGVQMSLRFFETMMSITQNVSIPGTAYLNAKTNYQIISGHPSKVTKWFERYFFVKVNEAFVPDLLREYAREWSPFYGR